MFILIIIGILILLKLYDVGVLDAIKLIVVFTLMALLAPFGFAWLFLKWIFKSTIRTTIALVLVASFFGGFISS